MTRKGRVIKTDQNEQFTVDLVICCAGNKINSDAYRSSLGKLFFVIWILYNCSKPIYIYIYILAIS